MLPCHHEALLRTGPVRPWDWHHAAVPTPVPLHVTQRIADSWLARDLAVTLRGNVWVGIPIDPARRRDFEVLKGVRSRERLPLALSP